MPESAQNKPVPTPETASKAASTPAGFARLLWIVTVVVALLVAVSFGLGMWAQNEFSPPESVVAAQSTMLATDGTLYYDLIHYPITVAAYMPLYYLLEAGLMKVGLPALTAGRLISFAAFLFLVFTVWRTVRLYTSDATLAQIAALLTASSPLMLWGVVGQVDLLAVSLAAAGFYEFSRYIVHGEATLWQTGLFCGLALFTKQTMIAVPAAIFFTLLAEPHKQDRKRAFQFAGVLGGICGSLVLAINFALGGRFLKDTLFSNLNPMSTEKLLQHLGFLVPASAGLLIILVLAGRRLLDRRLWAPLAYLVCAALVFLVTAPKIGSDTNYQLEVTVAMTICAVIGLQRLNFLPLLYAGSKSWVTLLILPIGIQIAVGGRIAVNQFLVRVATEQALAAQVAALAPHVAPRGGLVFSTDFNSMARLRGRLDVEPLIVGLLVNAGALDPEPVRQDLANRRFSTLILGEDLSTSETRTPTSDLDLELTAIPEVEQQAIRENYEVVEHVPGPFGDGLYVYKPKGVVHNVRNDRPRNEKPESNGHGSDGL